MLFFAITLGAHTEALFSCLYRLVDKRTGAVGIESFLRFVDRNAGALPHSSTSAVKQRVTRDFVILSELELQLSGLRERRNKVGAHISLEYLPDLGRQIGDDFPLNYTDIEAVIQELDFILGHYHEFCHGTQYVPATHDQFFYEDAVNEVIEHLEKSLFVNSKTAQQE